MSSILTSNRHATSVGPDESIDLTFAFDNVVADLTAFDRLTFWYGNETVGLPYTAGRVNYTPRIVDQHDGDSFYGVTYRLNTAWTVEGNYTFEADTQFVTSTGERLSDQWRFDFTIVPEPSTGLLALIAVSARFRRTGRKTVREDGPR